MHTTVSGADRRLIVSIVVAFISRATAAGSPSPSQEVILWRALSSWLQLHRGSKEAETLASVRPGGLPSCTAATASDRCIDRKLSAELVSDGVWSVFLCGRRRISIHRCVAAGRLLASGLIPFYLFQEFYQTAPNKATIIGTI